MVVLFPNLLASSISLLFIYLFTYFFLVYKNNVLMLWCRAVHQCSAVYFKTLRSLDQKGGWYYYHTRCFQLDIPSVCDIYYIN